MMDRRLIGLCTPLLTAVVLLSACGDGSGPTTQLMGPPSGTSKPAEAQQAGKSANAPDVRPEVEKPSTVGSRPAKNSNHVQGTNGGKPPPPVKQPTQSRKSSGPCAEDPGSHDCEESRNPEPSAPASESQRQFHGDEPASEPSACPPGGCKDSNTHP